MTDDAIPPVFDLSVEIPKAREVGIKRLVIPKGHQVIPLDGKLNDAPGGFTIVLETNVGDWSKAPPADR